MENTTFKCGCCLRTYEYESVDSVRKGTLEDLTKLWAYRNEVLINHRFCLKCTNAILTDNKEYLNRMALRRGVLT